MAASAAAAAEAAAVEAGEAGEVEKWRRWQQRQPTMMVLHNKYIVECVRFLLSCGYYCHFFFSRHFFTPEICLGSTYGYGKQNLQAEKY